MSAVLAFPAATVVTRADPGCDDVPTAQTPGSVWQEAAGAMIGDELLQWPPDMLAAT